MHSVCYRASIVLPLYEDGESLQPLPVFQHGLTHRDGRMVRPHCFINLTCRPFP